MTTTIKDEFMQRIATEEAWKKLSEDFAWTEALLEKNSEKVDWKEISENRNIVWTIPMLQKFSKKLDWEKLTDAIHDDWFTMEHLEAFKDKWVWSKIPANITLTLSIVEKYIDYWDWTELIDTRHDCYFGNAGTLFSNSFTPIDFYEKYKEYIPMSKLQDSYLWREMVEQRSKQLKAEILS